jgi:hypothetical protein
MISDLFRLATLNPFAVLQYSVRFKNIGYSTLPTRFLVRMLVDTGFTYRVFAYTSLLSDCLRNSFETQFL